ncbi:GIY-YIG nuclease family protein [uncultured Endozoicomonas sp.]|uniref:GIY-YIG nuclease family protein n=1 Tax=uncultured Endozoicomonas sp. TaxID=432652 RepID=UPI002636AE1D|nr:GIY-YIG nuclease family protein [uncultured Endozoicomonas sp.]
MPSDNWFVYIILASDNSLYTGITTDIKRRWRQHSGDIIGGARFFRGRKPEKLVYVEEGSDRSSVSKREAAIKKMTRQQKLKLLSNPANKSANWLATL